MDTKKFRTKTEFIERNNGHLPGIWEIALDIGYSAVKLFSPNHIACFPSYARRVNPDFQFAGSAPKEAILYKDLETNTEWLVGEVAQNTIASGDTSDSEASLYGRERYGSEMFSVISRVGLGLGMLKNQYGEPSNSEIVIQTGLPEKYMNDEDSLKDALCGEHNFALKIGTSDWKEFRFTLKKENIYVMSQPKGTLFSVCIDKNGRFHMDARKYLSSSIIVFDPGFGTLDLFPINSGVVGNGETYSDLGMKRVLQETSKLIQQEYNVDVPVPAMQKYLESGMIRYVNKKDFVAKEYPFGELLKQANEKICEEAIIRMAGAINLIDYNYMIITGGTGAAWMHYIENRFKDFSTLKLLRGNQNDNLSCIYSNVRGYYLYRFNTLGKELRKKEA